MEVATINSTRQSYHLRDRVTLHALHDTGTGFIQTSMLLLVRQTQSLVLERDPGKSRCAPTVAHRSTWELCPSPRVLAQTRCVPRHLPHMVLCCSPSLPRESMAPHAMLHSHRSTHARALGQHLPPLSASTGTTARPLTLPCSEADDHVAEWSSVRSASPLLLLPHTCSRSRLHREPTAPRAPPRRTRASTTVPSRLALA
jgi:hypothetical protein